MSAPIEPRLKSLLTRWPLLPSDRVEVREDFTAKAVYFTLAEGKIAYTRVLQVPGVRMDLDANGNVLGIEVA